MRLPLAITAIVLGILAPRGAVAWDLRAGAGTEFPIDLGVHGVVEGPGGLRLTTSLGYMPGVYVDAINATLIAFKAYDDTTADLIRATLDSSLVWKAHLGWRPFRRHGFTVEAGYRLVTMGGGLGTEDLIAAVTGSTPPSQTEDVGLEYNVSSTLHMADAELGWEWRLGGRLWLRAAVGGAFTFAATTTMGPKTQPRTPRGKEAVAKLGADGSAFLDNIYTSFVMSPVVNLLCVYEL